VYACLCARARARVCASACAFDHVCVCVRAHLCACARCVRASRVHVRACAHVRARARACACARAHVHVHACAHVRVRCCISAVLPCFGAAYDPRHEPFSLAAHVRHKSGEARQDRAAPSSLEAIGAGGGREPGACMLGRTTAQTLPGVCHSRSAPQASVEGSSGSASPNLSGQPTSVAVLPGFIAASGTAASPRGRAELLATELLVCPVARTSGTQSDVTSEHSTEHLARDTCDAR